MTHLKPSPANVFFILSLAKPLNHELHTFLNPQFEFNKQNMLPFFIKVSYFMLSYNKLFHASTSMPLMFSCLVANVPNL